MNKIFVTGNGRGFLAGHLIPKLIEQGHKVEVDIRYLETQKYDVIIHLAATTHTRTEFDPNIYYNNFLLTHKVFNQNCRIIYASSCSARHNTNPYASSKIWSEFLGEKHGNALGLRFFNIYGSGNRKGIVKFLMDQEDGSKITIRGPELVRDYIEVEDVVREIIKNISPNKEIKTGRFCKGPNCGPVMKPQLVPNIGVIDVGTGIGTSTKSLVDLYMELSGKRFEIQTIPADPSEPKSMISNTIVPHISLKEGLLKLIKNETIQVEATNSSN